MIQNVAHDTLCLFPLLRRALVLVARICRIPLREPEGAVVQQSHGIQEILCQLQAVLEFFFQLIRTQDVVTLGNGELAHTDQTVHLAGVLVPEQGGSFCQTHGQITVGTLAVQVNLILERAGHGTQGEAVLGLIVGIAQNEHAVQIVIPVAGDLVELPLCQQRCLGQQAAVCLFHVLDPALKQLNHSCALGQQHRQTLTDHVNRREVFQFPAQLVVVTLLGFLQLVQVLFQHGSLGECDGIDTGQHLVFLRTSPVCAGAGQKLECLDGASGHQVRAGAKVGEIALLVERDGFTLAHVLLAQLHLVRLIHFFQLCHSLFRRQIELFQLFVCLDDLLHLGLDLGQFLLAERVFYVKVVVETAVDCRADGQLCLRIQVLDCLRQHVRSGVPECFLTFFAVEGHDFKGAVVVDDRAQVTDLAVQLHAACSLVQTHANALDNFCRSCRSFQLPDAAVFQCQFDHTSIFLSKMSECKKSLTQ